MKSGLAAFAVLLVGMQTAFAAPQTNEVDRGRVQFQQSCAFCHGANAMGGAEGPSLTRSSVVRHDNNGDLIGAVIREGRPGKGMPAFPLTDSQIAAVVAFLHAQVAASDRTSAGHPSNDYSLKRLLTGDPAEGKKYFNGDGGCASCHSPTGDLAGIARKYAPVDLQSRFLYPSGKPSTATVTLASGEKITGELVKMDSFNVSIRDGEGWYHSWPCGDVKVQVHNPISAHIELLAKYTKADVHNLFAYLETLK